MLILSRKNTNHRHQNRIIIEMRNGGIIHWNEYEICRESNWSLTPECGYIIIIRISTSSRHHRISLEILFLYITTRQLWYQSALWHEQMFATTSKLLTIYNRSSGNYVFMNLIKLYVWGGLTSVEQSSNEERNSISKVQTNNRNQWIEHSSKNYLNEIKFKTVNNIVIDLA